MNRLRMLFEKLMMNRSFIDFLDHLCLDLGRSVGLWNHFDLFWFLKNLDYPALFFGNEDVAVGMWLRS